MARLISSTRSGSFSELRFEFLQQDGGRDRLSCKSSASATSRRSILLFRDELRRCRRTCLSREFAPAPAAERQIPPIAGAGAQAANGAFEVAHFGELRAKVFQRRRLSSQALHGVLSLPDRAPRRPAVAKANRAIAARPSA